MVKAVKKKAKKGIVEVVHHAFGHKDPRPRIDPLNERIYTAGEISQVLDVPENTLNNHLRRMLADGSIEIAKEKKKAT